MGRRNRRVSELPPEGDDGPAIESIGVELAQWRNRRETEAERNDRIRKENEAYRYRNERRADKRIAGVLDWNKCCIPECDAAAGYTWRPRLVTEMLPICQRHQVIISKQLVNVWDDPDYLAMRQRLARQRVVEEITEQAEEDLWHESNGATQGQIYFVRLGGLIKVGWASKLRSRLKSYGASAEVLCHFPGSRADETALHRNLRPYLAKGREWYQDCQLLSDVVDNYLRQYGPPTILPDWTVPKKDVICKRSA